MLPPLRSSASFSTLDKLVHLTFKVSDELITRWK